MRLALAENFNKEALYEATFDKVTSTIDRDGKKVILLRDIKDSKNNLLTDHMYLPAGDLNFFQGLNRGDRVEFTAIVITYSKLEKKSQDDEEEIRGMTMDYTLSSIRNLRRVNKNEIIIEY